MISEEKVRALVEAGGGIYKGIQENPVRGTFYAVFNDPQTGTTMMLPLDRLTVETIRAELADSRDEFKRKEQSE